MEGINESFSDAVEEFESGAWGSGADWQGGSRWEKLSDGGLIECAGVFDEANLSGGGSAEVAGFGELEREDAGAELECITVAKFVFGADLAVDATAVGAAEVTEDEVRSIVIDAGMMSRDFGVIQTHVAADAAADDDILCGGHIEPAASIGAVDDEQGGTVHDGGSLRKEGGGDSRGITGRGCISIETGRVLKRGPWKSGYSCDAERQRGWWWVVVFAAIPATGTGVAAGAIVRGGSVWQDGIRLPGFADPSRDDLQFLPVVSR